KGCGQQCHQYKKMKQKTFCRYPVVGVDYCRGCPCCSLIQLSTMLPGRPNRCSHEHVAFLSPPEMQQRFGSFSCYNSCCPRKKASINWFTLSGEILRSAQNDSGGRKKASIN